MSAHGAADEILSVNPDGWVTSVETARADGFTTFDFLDAVDEVGRTEEFRVVVRLVDWTIGRGRQLHVRIPRDEPRLDTISGVFAGASWHEREVHDFFGVEFTGGDPAPLLNHPVSGQPAVRWLRKDHVLAARAAQPWPGGKEPGEGPGAARRRMAPPGVPDPATWGNRDPALPPAAADEIAASVAGGRVRRRR